MSLEDGKAKVEEGEAGRAALAKYRQNIFLKIISVEIYHCAQDKMGKNYYKSATISLKYQIRRKLTVL